jgi:hypothetical protein
MTAAELFTAACRALWGDRFKAPAAATLEVSVDRVDDWSKGRGHPPPDGVWRELYDLLLARHAETANVAETFRREMPAAFMGHPFPPTRAR